MILPKISVIVPVYNVEHFLIKCLESIAKQTFSDYEVIIVNDGSTDNSLKIAEDYIKIYEDKFKIINQKNGGLGDARNTGIANATGEYLLFVDSDDTISNNALEHLNSLVSKTQADIVIFDYKLVDEYFNELFISPGYKINSLESNIKEDPALLLSSPSACNKLFKSELFIKSDIRFPKKVWFEDLRTIPKLYLQSNKIIYSNLPLYNYVQRKGSIMNNVNLDRNKEIIYAIEDISSYYDQHNLSNRYKEELEFLCIFHVLLTASVRVNKSKFNHPLLKEFYNFILIEYPDFMSNKYVMELSFKEKTILLLLLKKRYRLLSILIKLKNLF